MFELTARGGTHLTRAARRMMNQKLMEQGDGLVRFPVSHQIAPTPVPSSGPTTTKNFPALQSRPLHLQTEITPARQLHLHYATLSALPRQRRPSKTPSRMPKPSSTKPRIDLPKALVLTWPQYP